MAPDVSRRHFLEIAGVGGAFATLRSPLDSPQGTPAPAWPGDALTGWFDRPMRWVAAHARRERSRPLRSAVLARLLPPRPRRRRVPQRRRHRRVLPDRRSRCTIAARGSARAIRSARSSPAAARSGCTSSRAPIRTPCATRCGRRTRTGLPSPAPASRAGIGPIPSCGSPARSVPTTSSSWTRSTARSSTKYKVDGIFANRWAPQGGDCYCVHCQPNFKAATGLELPRTTDARDPARRQFLEWRKARLTELWKRLGCDASAAINPEARFIPNGPPDLKTAGELAEIQFADYQARRGVTPPWANGRRAKEFRSVMGRRPIGGIFSVGLEEPYRWKDSVQSEPEIRLWVAEGTANGMRPWVTKFSGVLYDRRWLPIVERIYQWHARHERYLRNEMPLARVALLHSEQTETFHPGVAAGRPRRRSRARHVPRARRGARAVRDGARGVSHAGPARSVQAADSRGRRGAVGRAVRRHPRVRRPRRQRARHVRDLALRRDRASGAPTSGSPISSACRSAAASTGRCRTRI